MQIRVLNLGTAPASTTTWTIGMMSVAPLNALDVAIQDVRPMSLTTGVPVEVIRTVGVGTTAVTLASTTVTASTPVTASAYAVVTTASTNAAVVKASAGNLYEITAANPTATALFIKLYNKATAPTVGTDVPLMTLSVPATTCTNFEFGALGKRFTSGIAIATTAAIIATDTGVVLAGTQISASYL
jgi:hypothetical protein